MLEVSDRVGRQYKLDSWVKLPVDNSIAHLSKKNSLVRGVGGKEKIFRWFYWGD